MDVICTLISDDSARLHRKKGWALCDKSQQRAEVHKITRAYPHSERRLSISSSNIPFSPSAFTKETHWLSKRIQPPIRKEGKRRNISYCYTKECSNGKEPRCIETFYCSHSSLSGFPTPLSPHSLPSSRHAAFFNKSSAPGEEKGASELSAEVCFKMDRQQ